MHTEHSITVQAPAARIFALYENVAGWHLWDPDTRQASIAGPFAVGTRGSLTPTQGRTVPMLITQVQADAGFTVEARIPLLCMRFEHELQPVGGAVRVTHRVHFSGLLGWVIGPMMIRRLNHGLPITLDNLRRCAEAAR
ncbi:SRPBCC family protein [Aquabacterium sp. OR-4]|uniref:SRPBCC family protein n=1 Tax=Aquabacterium sp. OR-4 TaxID=2978127 RepID=UPI0021B4AC30|nr:SRPBCC family protein [Aquabacterium sp. OR-4]MDT7838028.1 SRPBCC family protein [Aquabacterium sp. OR-4]